MKAAPTIPPRIGLIACRVFEDELALHAAANVVELRYLEIGLHDRPDGLRAALREEIAAVDAREDIDAIVLAYALCGLGTAGLRAGRHRLVLPRAHDCITVFMGNKEKFARQQAARPDSYYYTPGWMRANRTPGPERLEALREEFAKKFDPEDVEFLIESERAAWAQHGRAVFLDLGTEGADGKAAEAERAAAGLGWEFERMEGDPGLLRDLLDGRWDAARFQIIEPGETLAHAANAEIFATKPADGTPPTPGRKQDPGVE